MRRTCQDCGDPYDGGPEARFCRPCRIEHSRKAIRARRKRVRDSGRNEFYVVSRKMRDQEMDDGYLPPDCV